MPDPVPQITIPFTGGTTDAGNPFGIPGGSVPYVEPPSPNYAPQTFPDVDVTPAPPSGGDDNAHPPPPQPPQPAPPIYTDVGLGGAFFGALESKRPRLTKLGRMYEEAIKIGTKAIFKGALEATTGFFKRGATRVSQAAEAEEIRVGAQALGRGVIVRGSPTAAETVLREVLRRNAEEVGARGVSYVARGLAFVGGLAVGGLLAIGVEALLPNRAGYTDAQEKELLRQAAEMERRATFTWDNAAADRALRTARTPVDLNPIGQYPLGFPVDEIVLPDTLVKRSLLQRVLPYVADELPEALQRAARESAKGTPASKPAPAPGGVGSTSYGQIPQAGPPAPTSSSPSSSAGPGRLPRPGVRWGMIAIGAGSIVAANTILPRLFGNPYSGSQTAAPAPSTPPSQNVTPPTSTTSSPALGSFAIGGYSGGGQYCEPRPRGPRRKCLERAPVAWRSGSRKGKSAGSKCLRYASRRT